MGFNSLNDVLQEQLEDLHSAETQLVGALPKMAQAAHHEPLREAFQHHLDETREHVSRVGTGRFQAMMDVELVNDGPVTIILDSEKTF